MLALLTRPCAALAALTIAIVLLSGPWAARPAEAQAATPRDDWVLTLNRRPSDKLIAFCGVEAIFTNDHNVIIARTPDGMVSLAIGLPEARFPREPGEPIPSGRLDLEITRNGDPIRRSQVGFGATRPDLITMPLGEDGEFYRWFGRGRELIVRGSQTTLRFALKGTLDALGEVDECLCANKPNEPESLRALRVLLETSGLRNFDFVAVPEGSPLDVYADVIWFYGKRTEDCRLRADEDVVGGMFERALAPEDPQDFDSQVQTYLTVARTGCETDLVPEGGTRLPGGTFAGGPIGEVYRRGGVTMVRADTTCRDSDGNLNHAKMVLASDGRVFTVFFHLGPDSNADTLGQRRDRIAGLLQRLTPVRVQQPSGGGE